MKTILLTCGETSGEHHASRMVSELKHLDPGCRILALGGRELEGAGAEILFRMEDFAFMGLSEIVTGLPRVLSLERKLKLLLGEGGIDLFIPVDYPGLNLRLAAHAHRAGVPVLYFVSPQVWAWGGWRVRKMRGVIDLMAVILPFEEEIYRNAGIPAVFVGYPLLDEVDEPPEPKKAPKDQDGFKVMMFPGSRRQEVDRILPPMLGAARLLKSRFPRAEFGLGLAPLIEERDLAIPEDLRACIEVTREGTGCLGVASLVLAASGTVTLLSAISGTPMVVLYKTSQLTYLIGKSLVKIPWIAMPNVLAGRRLVPELVQGEAVPGRVADEAVSILLDGERYAMMSGELLGLRRRLEGQGGSSRVAEIALEMVEGRNIGEIVNIRKV